MSIDPVTEAHSQNIENVSEIKKEKTTWDQLTNAGFFSLWMDAEAEKQEQLVFWQNYPGYRSIHATCLEFIGIEKSCLKIFVYEILSLSLPILLLYVFVSFQKNNLGVLTGKYPIKALFFWSIFLSKSLTRSLLK